MHNHALGSVPFQVVQLSGDGGLDSRLRGNDGLSEIISAKLERYLTHCR